MGDFPYLEYLTKLYHEKAKQSREWWDYLKAHGLANFCATLDSRESRLRKVYEVETSWYNETHPLSFEEHRALTEKHKYQLLEYRKSTKESFERLTRQQTMLDIENIFGEDNLNNAEILAHDVFKASEMCSKDFIQLSNSIIESSVNIILKNGYGAPCPFVVAGLGSVARGEATPYSDLEYIFIIESDSSENIDYFKRLAVDSYFRIANLCESPLKTFNIEEVVSLTTNKYCKFSETVVGYRIDGITPEAGNIPTGNPGGQSLITTVSGLIEIYKTSLLSPAGKLAGKSDLLCSTAKLYCNQHGGHLLDEFHQERLAYEREEVRGNDGVVSKRLHMLLQDVENYNFLPKFSSFGPPENFEIKVKADIFRYPTLLAHNISMFLALDVQYPWQTYSQLCEYGILSAENCKYMLIVLALSLYTRTNAYIQLESKSDSISLYPPGLVIGRIKQRYHIPANVFVLLGCLLIPLKTAISRNLQDITRLRQSSCDTESCSFSNSNENDLQIINIVKNVFKSIAIVRSNLLLKVEVLYFAGDHISALRELYNSVGKDIVDNSCVDSIKAIQTMCNKEQSIFTHQQLVEISCYLLLSNRKYQSAAGYLKWLINSATSKLHTARWKILLADCLNKTLNYVEAFNVLVEVFHLLRGVLEIKEHNTLYNHLGGMLTETDNINEEVVKQMEVTSHAYKVFADSSRYLKFFGQANDCMHISLNISQPFLSRMVGSTTLEVQYLNLVGDTHFEKGEYSKALRHYQDLLKRLTDVHGESTNHPDIAAAFSSIAKVSLKIGEFEEAIKFFDNSLKIYKDVYSHDNSHPDITLCLNNLGIVYMNIGDFAKSLDFLQCKHSQKHPDDNTNLPVRYLSNYVSLGKLFRLQGHYAKSLEQFEMAVNLVKFTTSIVEHPDIADIYGEMAKVYSDLGDYPKSLAFQTQSIEMMQAIYNQLHPYKVRACRDLVNINQEFGTYTKALQEHSETLDMNMFKHGTQTDHTDIATSYSNLGMLYNEIGEYDKSVECHTKSLVMQKALYGDEEGHPDIAQSYNSIAETYCNMCEYEKALEYCTMSLALRKLAYNESNHPEIASSFYVMGYVYARVTNYSKALEYFSAALEMRKSIYGNDAKHADIANSYHSVGHISNQLRNLPKALDYHNQALQMRISIYGGDIHHKDILLSYQHLATVYIRMSKFSTAIDYLNKGLSVAEHVFGECSNHPLTALLYHLIGIVYGYLSDTNKALHYCLKALTMRKVIYGESSRHMDICRTSNNIGVIYEDMGMHSIARGFYECALKGRFNTIVADSRHEFLAVVYLNTGFQDYKMGKFETALKHYLNAADIFTHVSKGDPNNPRLAVTYNYIGALHRSMGNFSSSEDFHIRSLKMLKNKFGQTASHVQVAKNLLRTGTLYHHKGELRKSLTYLHKALEMLKVIYSKDQNHISSTYRHIGHVHYNLGEYSMALGYYNLALEMLYALFGSSCNQYDVAEILSSLGSMYCDMGEYPLSLEYHTQSVHMRLALEDNLRVGQSLLAFGQLYHRVKLHDHAVSLFTQLFPAVASHPIDSLRACCRLSQVLIDMSEYTRALQFLHIAVSKEPRYDQWLTADIIFTMGRCYLQLGLLSQSWSYLYSSLTFYQSQPKYDQFSYVLAQIHLSIGHLLLRVKDVQQSQEHSRIALDISTQLVANQETFIPKYVELHREAIMLLDSLTLIKMCQSEFAYFTTY